MSIDFQSLKVLAKAPSKKYVRKLFQYVIMTRTSYNSFDPNYVTPVSLSLADDLELSEAQLQSLVIYLGNLIDLAGKKEFNNLDGIFPEDFESDLKEMLISMLQSLKEMFLKMEQTRLTQAEKLVGFDWRLDMQMANQTGRKCEPMALLSIESVGLKGFKTTGFQMGVEQIGAFHQNLKKIKDQLNSLIS